MRRTVVWRLRLEASGASDGDDAASRHNAESAIGALIVADTRLYRDGLAEILRRQQAVRVLATAVGAHDALARARSLSPDVILIDMTTRDAMQTLQVLARGVPEARILALGVPEAEEDVIACVEAGAAACVPREAALEEVVSAAEGIARGEAPCSPRMTAAIFRRVRAAAAERPEDLGERLTPREREIVALIDEGLSNKEIAQRLYIETPTVKNHVHNILEKLHVSGRAEAAAAVRRGSGVRRSLEMLVAPYLWHALGEPAGLVLSGPWA